MGKLVAILAAALGTIMVVGPVGLALAMGALIAPEPKPAPRAAIARERIGSPRLRMTALDARGAKVVPALEIPFAVAK